MVEGSRYALHASYLISYCGAKLIRILLPICSFRQCRFLVFLYHQLFCLFASFNQIEKAFLCVFFQGAGDLLCSISRAFRWLELKMQRVRGFKFANSNQNLKTGYLLAADAAPTAGVKFCFTQHLVGLLQIAYVIVHLKCVILVCSHVNL
nr:uncharacterized protein LOC104648428 isoform X1 [Solanum lycopersicum]